jgi:hypothetical protein
MTTFLDASKGFLVALAYNKNALELTRNDIFRRI